MEELQAKCKALREEMKKKYDEVITKVAEKNHVGKDTGFDMLIATIYGGTYAEGIEFDVEELKKDYAEYKNASIEVAKLMEHC